MADSVHLVVTKGDGTVVDITGTITDAVITETAPAPPAPSITAVKVSASPSTVQTGAQAQLTATVQGTGSFSSAVTWSASAGSITSSGVFTAPAAASSVVVTATSAQDPTKSGSVTIVVQAPPPPNAAPTIPANAKVVNMLTPPNAWQGNHDPGTPGGASGTTTYPVAAPGGTQNCREFSFNTSGKGGMIYHTSAIPSGANAFNRFAYRKREMKIDPGGWGTIGQCETDLEITGQTSGIPYDMAMQQDANDGQEDITINHKWTGTGIKVNPTTRANGVWHESVEYVGFDRVALTVTYFGVEIDGVYYPINKTVTDADNAVWAKDDLNFQLQWDSNQDASTNHVILCSLLEVDAWAE